MTKSFYTAIKVVLAILLLWLSLARCVIFKNRWSDAKAQKVFARHNQDLKIYDTAISNRHLHYAVTGPDTLPTLVFIHGSPGSWMNYWKFMLDSSLTNNFRIISIDRPGFGFSDFGDAMHLKEQCDLILPILKEQKGSKPMLLYGHSLGGAVVMQLAAFAPDLFERVFVVAGALDPALEKPETWRRIMSYKPLYWMLPGAFAASNTELLYLKKDLIPLQDEFSKITSPVHFIHGDEDTWVPIQNVAFGFKMLINAKQVTSDTVFGGDHNIPWNKQVELTRLLLKHSP